jgi:hypothetical protein
MEWVEYWLRMARKEQANPLLIDSLTNQLQALRSILSAR